jgi:hypothetical protein
VPLAPETVVQLPRRRILLDRGDPVEVEAVRAARTRPSGEMDAEEAAVGVDGVSTGPPCVQSQHAAGLRGLPAPALAPVLPRVLAVPDVVFVCALQYGPSRLQTSLLFPRRSLQIALVRLQVPGCSLPGGPPAVPARGHGRLTHLSGPVPSGLPRLCVVVVELLRARVDRLAPGVPGVGEGRGGGSVPGRGGGEAGGDDVLGAFGLARTAAAALGPRGIVVKLALRAGPVSFVDGVGGPDLADESGGRQIEGDEEDGKRHTQKIMVRTASTHGRSPRSET